MADRHSHKNSIIDPTRRQAIVSSFFGLSAVILGRLWYLQVIEKDNFSVASSHNRIREIICQAPRGLILDRHDQILLDNKMFFDLIVIPQFLKDKNKILEVISEILHIPVKELEEKFAFAKRNAGFEPIRLKKNLSLDEIAIIESNKLFLPGVDIDSVPRRNYHPVEPSHLLGYLGEVTEKEIDVFNANAAINDKYRPGSIVGKSGIEKKYEQYLHGLEGREAILVDAYGRIQLGSAAGIASYLETPAQQGSSVYLTIDKELQAVAMESFKEKNGAVCALIPDTGEVLVYLSNPSPDLALHQDSLRADAWQALRNDPFKPLLDKVTGGAYPPGSTFKTITAIAALQEGAVTPEQEFFCPGYFRLGNNVWKCWKHSGHGKVNMLKAIECSCDVYFYNVGHLTGIDNISKWGRNFGLGAKTGLDLNMELRGISPSTEWKIKTRGQPWTPGDTINASIGQGFNLCTPIQILNAYAAVGNGGRLMRPYLVKKIVDLKGKTVFTGTQSVIHNIKMNHEHWMLIKQGLFNVVQAGSGTAHRARVPGFTVAGKTGTAQTSSLKFFKKNNVASMNLLTRDHAWFAAYSPSDKPEIAVVVFSEYDGGHGGSNAAPTAQKIIEAYWRRKFPEKFKKEITEGENKNR